MLQTNQLRIIISLAFQLHPLFPSVINSWVNILLHNCPDSSFFKPHSNVNITNLKFWNTGVVIALGKGTWDHSIIVLINLIAWNDHHHSLSHALSIGKEFKSSLVGWFWLEGPSWSSSQDSGCGAADTWGFTGVSKTACSCGWQVGAGC